MAKAELFDAAEYLQSTEDMAHYLSEALSTGDAEYVAHALGIVARAQGMTEVAKGAGLSREHLYKALSTGGNPELGTFLKVLSALHVRLEAHPAS